MLSGNNTREILAVTIGGVVFVTVVVALSVGLFVYWRRQSGGNEND